MNTQQAQSFQRQHISQALAIGGALGWLVADAQQTVRRSRVMKCAATTPSNHAK